MYTFSRRSVLMGTAAALLGGRVALAAVPSEGRERLVVILLRGGLDGLMAVPVPGDPAYLSARGEMAQEEALKLDGTFALHPSLQALMPLWDARQLAIVHATCGPYQERSHFDAQNVLENGTSRPFGAESGWLSRAVASLGGEPSALAAGRSVPLLLRGPARAGNADPRKAPRVTEALLEQLETLYAGDPLLASALAEARRTEALVARHRDPSRDDKDGLGTLGRVLADPGGPQVAVLERGGWDTHTGQRQTLGRGLRELAASLVALKEGLGAAWERTAVLVLTEFGRRVRGNGTGGTDHGVGGVALLLGGAVRGGHVLADWPGLSPSALLQERDLRPTTDLRAVCAGVLRDHLGVREAALATEVFPGKERMKLVEGLIRA